MEDTILHSGSMTVSIDGTVAVAGKLPTLDEIAYGRAYRRYMAACDDLSDWRDDRTSDSEE